MRISRRASVDVIRAKRDGKALSRHAIDAFVAGVTDGSWPDYQASALLMAIVLRGMNAEETAWLTDAMVRSGSRVDLSGAPRHQGRQTQHGRRWRQGVDCAGAAGGGLRRGVPKMSGRGLGHTGGTLDKLEAIPGFRVALVARGVPRRVAGSRAAASSARPRTSPPPTRSFMRCATSPPPSRASRSSRRR